MIDRSGLPQAVYAWTQHLLAYGYCVIPDLATPAEIAALDTDLAPDFEATPFCEGRFYGERTKRFGRLLIRSPRVAPLVQHKLVLGVVESILSPWCDTIQLNLAQAIAVHPGALAQMPHRDQDMWRGQTGEIEYLVNVTWPFTRYTRQNGATRLWPESHGAKAMGTLPEAGEDVPELGPARRSSSWARRFTPPAPTEAPRSAAA